MSPTGLVEHLSTVPDPRVARTRVHRLEEILAIALLAAIDGSDGWDDIADFAEDRESWLRAFLELPGGLPCADTYRRVFEAIDTAALGACLAAMTSGLTADLSGKVVAIDGKTMRRSFDRRSGMSALHVVSAWVAEGGITLGQIVTDEKSNEITAIPELLKTIDVKGAIVTIDAMGCQKKIAASIVDAGADYALALKDNHPTLRTEVEGVFAAAEAGEMVTKKVKSVSVASKGHGRREVRRVSVCQDVAALSAGAEWRKLKSVVKVERQRTVGDTTSSETAYYLSSLRLGPKAMEKAIRSHWSIENSLHWVLDVVFGEDACRVRSVGGATNLAALRKLALVLLNLEKSKPGMSIARKRKRAGRVPDYAFDVLSNISLVLDALALGDTPRASASNLAQLPCVCSGTPWPQGSERSRSCWEHSPRSRTDGSRERERTSPSTFSQSRC